MLAIEAVEQAQLELLQIRRRRAAIEIRDRLRTARDAGTGKDAREEVAGPDLAAGVRHLGGEHDVARQILILSAETVRHPTPDAGTLECHTPGMDAERSLEVIVMVAANRADDAQVVGLFGDVREQVRDLGPGLAARFGRPG